METIILIVHVFVAIGLIGLIMLQQGKGAEAGASFGAGAHKLYLVTPVLVISVSHDGCPGNGLLPVQHWSGYYRQR